MFEQEMTGVKFDIPAARELQTVLAQRRTEILNELRATFEGKRIEMKTPEYFLIKTKTGDVWKASTKTKLQNKLREWKKQTDYSGTFKSLFDRIEEGPVRIKEVPFNPASRQHIAQGLTDLYGWVPREFTDTGQPKVDETVLESLEYPVAKLFTEYLLVNKRLGQLAEGMQAWLKKVADDGRIHGRVIHNGAVTGRATHSSPNLGQVPASYSPYGAECRSLFVAKPGYKLVGSDADGLELRCLANFLKPYDDGLYEQAVCEGSKEEGTDIHTLNQISAGLKTRDEAKKFIYTWLYGGGNYKIGLTVGFDETEKRELLAEDKLKKSAEWYFKQQNKYAKQYKKQPKAYTEDDHAAYIKGALLKEQFLEANQAVADLGAQVKEEAEANGYLIGLDGRQLHIRHSHAALNTLLQSAGALTCKVWLVLVNKRIREEGLDAKQVLWTHDEGQWETLESHAKRVAEICVEEMPKVIEHFPTFTCPLIANALIGDNWKETH